jgi:hypothetical protein
VPKLLLTIQEDPSFPQPYRYLAACYALMGRLDDERSSCGCGRLAPFVIHAAVHLRNAEQRELFLSGLRFTAGEAT